MQRYSPASIAKLLGIKEAELRALVAAGEMPAPLEGGFDLVEAVQAYVSHLRARPVDTGAITTAELAKLLGVSEQAVRDHASRDVIPKLAKNRYERDAAVPAYCAHLREVAAGRQGEDPDAPDLTDERARLAKAQADAQEMKNAQMRGELLPREDVDAAVAAAFARVRARLIGIPAKVAPVVVTMESPAEAQAAVRDAVYEALRELSETSIADLCGDDGELVAPAGPAAGPDGQPVG